MSKWPNQVAHLDAAISVESKGMKSDNITFLGDIGDEGVFLILGFGDGVFIRELVKQSSDGHIIVIYEKDISKLRWALQRRNFSKVLAAPKVFLLSGPVMDLSWLHVLQPVMVNGRLWIIRDKAATGGDAFYDDIIKKIKAEKQFADINLGTQISLGKQFANAILKNVPEIITARGINELYNRYKGMAAIVVSSGPSIAHEIETIKKAKGKVVILCVDTALPVLLKNKIQPDFVCGIDPLPDNKALFDTKEAMETPLVCMSQYTPDVLKDHSGQVFISAMDGNTFYQWLHWFWPEKGNLESFGGSVSHFATNAAQYMGCDPIGLVGQDLSFKKKLHAGGVNKRLHDFMGLEEPDETKNAVKEKNCNGKYVYTKPTLVSFRTAFENKIATDPTIHLINLTQNGLTIKGMETMLFKTYLERYGKDILDFSLPEKSVKPPDIPGLLDRIGTAIKVLKRIVRTNHTILDLIHKTIDARKIMDKESIRRYVKRIEVLRPKTLHPILSLISVYHYHLEIYMKRHSIKQIDGMRHKWKRLDRQLDRGLNFYAEVIEASDLLIKELIVLKRRLKKIKSNDEKYAVKEQHA